MVIAQQIGIVGSTTCGGPATVTRTDVLVRLGQGEGYLAKKYYHLGLICQLHVGVAFMVTFGCFKDNIILLFTDVAPVVSYLQTIFPFLLMLQMLHPLYATLSTILRLMNESEYLAWINFVSMIVISDLSAGLWLFCTDYYPAYFFIGLLFGRLVGHVWSFRYISRLNWISVA
jgi:Na+-driven multidrug efflux pump